MALQPFKNIKMECMKKTQQEQVNIAGHYWEGGCLFLSEVIHM